MSDIVNDYFKRFYSRTTGRSLPIFPKMRCADGFEMSVQGHYGAYCSPRVNYADRYTAVEVGYPSEREELLMPYVEDADRPTDTVYGYVPVEVIEKVIEKHGGLVGSQPDPRAA